MFYNPYEGRDEVMGIALDERNYNYFNFNFKTRFIIDESSNVTAAYRGDVNRVYPYAYNWIYAMEHYREIETNQNQVVITYDRLIDTTKNMKMKFNFFRKETNEGPRGIELEDYFSTGGEYNPDFGLYGLRSLVDDSGFLYTFPVSTDQWVYRTENDEEVTIPFVTPGSVYGGNVDDITENFQSRADFEWVYDDTHTFQTGFEAVWHHLIKDHKDSPWYIDTDMRNAFLNKKANEMPGVVDNVEEIIDPETGEVSAEIHHYTGNGAYDSIYYPVENGEIDEDNAIIYWKEDVYYETTVQASGITQGYEAYPIQGAFYVQDRMEWEGLIVSAGLRFDMWYLNNDYDLLTDYYTGSYLEFIKPDVQAYDANGEPINASNPVPDDLVQYYGEYLYQPGGTLDPEVEEWQNAQDFYEKVKDQFETMKIMVSPRLGISHPISETSVIHFAYNYQNQLPEMEQIFRAISLEQAAKTDGTARVGNPAVEPRVTITYEVGLRQQLSEDYVFDITTYFKNNYNYENYEDFDEYIRPLNDAYGSARGIDLNLTKLLSEHISGSMSYTLAWAEGNASAAFVKDGSEDLRETPLNWDIRHQGNFSINFRVENGNDVYLNPIYRYIFPPFWLYEVIDQELVSLGKWGEFSTTFTFDVSSGRPYTKITENDTQDGETNSARMDMTYNADLKITKRFDLGDIEDNPSQIRLYLQISNLFNNRYDRFVYPKTGDPYASGADVDTPTEAFMQSMIDSDPSNISEPRTFVMGMAYTF